MATLRILAASEAERWIAARSEPVVDEDARTVAARIIALVRESGDSALRELTRRLDGVEVTEFETPPQARRAALDALPAERRAALERARANIETFHRPQLRREEPIRVAPGVQVWREFRAIERVGLYVPGGRAQYPSSVLMAGVPARLAGCDEIVVVAPPAPDGRPPAAVLAAAELLGIERVFAVGGAQAIAALTCGTASIPRVHKIFGPGNRYVTAAKQLVYGTVDIDMPAGPSEIVMLADRSARPDWLAADLISQAEHAPDTMAVLVTDDPSLAEAVGRHVDDQVARLPEPDVARTSLTSSAVCVAPDFASAIAWVNSLAAEHLTIVTRDDPAVLPRIRHAGSIFLGPYSPVAAGDYAAGSNHILPTGGRARAWAALSVDDFGRWVQIQRLEEAGLASLRQVVSTLARWEGLEAHARAVEIRFEEAS